jgi:hypothetical protein
MTAVTDFDSTIHHTHAARYCSDAIVKATAEWNTAIAENDVSTESRALDTSIVKL